MKLSVVISAYNEEKNIERVLSSVKFADEIIVVDNESSDKTAQIAEKMGAKVLSQPNKNMLNINKNFGFGKATGEWILNLDADEEITQELKEEILLKINDGKVNGFWIPRKNIIFGKWIRHSLWSPDYQLRLFKRGEGKFPCVHVHEPMTVNGETAHVQNPMVHYNYQTISQYLYKLDKLYTENEAEQFTKSGKKLKWTDVINWPMEDFLKTFFLQKGYKDGLHGLVLSLLQAIYQVVIFTKIWEKNQYKIEEPSDMLPSYLAFSKKAAMRLRYWQYQSLITESSSPIIQFLLKLKRKINL